MAMAMAMAVALLMANGQWPMANGQWHAMVVDGGRRMG
jgi:hypothetical protein